MDNNALLKGLKSGDTACVQILLNSVDSSNWPVETLIPFVLKEMLQSSKKYPNLSYIEKCFRMFTSLQRLQDIQRSKAVELHKMILLTKCLMAMLTYRDDDMDKLSDYVMRKFQFIMSQYGSCRYGRQFKYLVTVCHHRSRLLDFQKKFHPLRDHVIERLHKRCLDFIENLISIMIT
ncbi:hypothetical protein V3C99_005330 [Haemonchus contortus]